VDDAHNSAAMSKFRWLVWGSVVEERRTRDREVAGSNLTQLTAE